MNDKTMNAAGSGNANEALEAMIAEEFLANLGVIVLDYGDVRSLKDSSDFIDGTTADGKVDGLGRLVGDAISKLQDAHPGSHLVGLLLKMRMAEGTGLFMEPVAQLQEVLSSLDESVNIKWGLEKDAPVPSEVRICVICGFKWR